MIQMAEYYTEVPTAHGSYNRYDSGSIDQIRKLAIKRIEEKNGYGAYIHQKTSYGWVMIGRIGIVDDIGVPNAWGYIYYRYLFPNGYKKASRGSTSYKLFKDGHISKAKWTYRE